MTYWNSLLHALNDRHMSRPIIVLPEFSMLSFFKKLFSKKIQVHVNDVEEAKGVADAASGVLGQVATDLADGHFDAGDVLDIITHLGALLHIGKRGDAKE